MIDETDAHVISIIIINLTLYGSNRYSYLYKYIWPVITRAGVSVIRPHKVNP